MGFGCGVGGWDEYIAKNTNINFFHFILQIWQATRKEAWFRQVIKIEMASVKGKIINV